MGVQNFIKTQDEYTKTKLIEMGFCLLSEENGMYIFVNKGIMSFDDDNMKILFSNNLTF